MRIKTTEMNIKVLWSALLLTGTWGCGENPAAMQASIKQEAREPAWKPPVAGTIVDRLEQRIKEDQLNDAYYRVSVISTDSSAQGVYLLKLEYGFNSNETTITLPKWHEGVQLKPVLKAGPEPYQCLIGFSAEDDRFHEYYEAVSESGSIRLKQTTGYYPTP